MSTALDNAVTDAYRAFKRHKNPAFPLDVCLSCCVSHEVEKQLREHPLHDLTAKQFYEYNCSAKSETQDAHEVGYFLPRMFELMAHGAEIHHSIEISLDRLGRCPPDGWKPDERAAISRYALAYFDGILRGDERVSRWQSDPLSVLLMFDVGAIDIEPLLALWLECDHPASTVQFVKATYWDFWEECDYSNSFASDRPDFRRKLRDWLLNAEHKNRFAGKMVTPDFLALAEAQPAVGHTSFSTMMEGVFEQLVQ